MVKSARIYRSVRLYHVPYTILYQTTPFCLMLLYSDSIFIDFQDANNLGCFPKTSLTTTPYPVELGTDPFKCIFGCGQLNLPYALLTNGGQCLCGSGIAIAEKLADDLCNVPCRDKVMLTCGGDSFYAVYQVTNYDNATFHISAPTWTKENTPTTFAFTANDGTIFELYRKHASLSTALSQLELTFEHLDLEVT